MASKVHVPNLFIAENTTFSTHPGVTGTSGRVHFVDLREQVCL
jgi:hypothetical protein